ncbi:MAG: hypothetical protein EOO38_15565, partial [Cytophagaceae bacterium]
MDKITPSEPRTGTLTIAEIAEADPASVALMGKAYIQNSGARYKQISGLKPGSKSIRTPQLEEEVFDRLMMGETLAWIMLDQHMPAISTWYSWAYADPELARKYEWALAMGQRTRKDFNHDVAEGGALSSGDVRRDALIVQANDTNAKVR